MNKLIWLWKCFWGKKYKIVFTNKVKTGEILVSGSKFYINKDILYNIIKEE